MTEKPMSEIQQMILDGEPVLRQILHPTAQLLRKSAVQEVQAGRPDNQCPHPIGAVGQYVDDVGTVGRDGREVNLWQCDVCKEILWLVSPHGRAASDG